MAWVETASGGVATNPRAYDLFIMDPDDGPPNWWRFRYRTYINSTPGWENGWDKFEKSKFYDIDVRSVGIPGTAKAVFFHCMLNMTRPARLSGSHHAWATVVHPSEKANIDTTLDDTGRGYGEKTFRLLSNMGSQRLQQGTWVALQDSKVSIRAWFAGNLNAGYPKNPGYMIRISAAAYQN
jgi:hypothetical protein